MLRGERRHRAEFRVGRMRHHGRIDAAQRSAFDQDYFSAAAFLSRRAEKNNSSRQLVRDALQTRDRAERGARNQVMPARMPVRQRIVLGKNRNDGTFSAELSAKRSLEPANSALNLEPQLSRSLAQQVGGEMLFELKLRMLMNLVTERDNFVAIVINRACDL